MWHIYAYYCIHRSVMLIAALPKSMGNHLSHPVANAKTYAHAVNITSQLPIFLVIDTNRLAPAASDPPQPVRHKAAMSDADSAVPLLVSLSTTLRTMWQRHRSIHRSDRWDPSSQRIRQVRKRRPAPIRGPGLREVLVLLQNTVTGVPGGP